MGYGKYSVEGYKRWPDGYSFDRNVYGQPVTPWNIDYNTETMFPNYDEDGYDSYGYSAFDSDGDFVGHGEGVDRVGMSESDYQDENLKQPSIW